MPDVPNPGAPIAMRHHHTSFTRDERPTGVAVDSGPHDAVGVEDDITREFWGATRGWVSGEQAATRSTGRLRRTSGPVEPAGTDAGRDASAVDATGPVRLIRDGVAAFRPKVVDRRGDVDRTRSHGIVRPTASQVAAVDVDASPPGAGRDSTIGELGAGAPTWAPELDDWPLAPMARIDDDITTSDDTTTSMARPVREHVPDSRTDRVRQPGDRPIDRDPTTSVPVVGLGSVDPYIKRIGLAVLALALLVPLAIALRPAETEPQLDSVVIDGVDGSDTAGGQAAGDEVADDEAAMPEGAVAETAGAPATVSPEIAADPAAATTTAPEAGDESAESAAASSSSSGSSPAPSEAADPDTDTTASAAATTDAAPATEATEAAAASQTDAAQVSEQSEQDVPACPQQYTAAPGDSWYRIADASGIGVEVLLAENTSALDTVLFPGDEVCLTADATIPSPPATTPATTAAPTTPSTAPPATSAPTTAAPTTAAPTTAATTTAAPTTAAPTTAAPAAPSEPASESEVKALIREIWPEDQHEMAFNVARRESNYNPTVFNGFCCYGVFQIYYSVHQSWLRDYGINSSSDLLDARKNITAAYALYQRSGGWSPWRQTAY